jgi:hypothetical protein
VIFCQVVRIYKGRRSVLYEGDHRGRAELAYARKLRSGPRGLRDGDLVLYVDGAQERAFHGGYNRTQW